MCKSAEHCERQGGPEVELAATVFETALIAPPKPPVPALAFDIEPVVLPPLAVAPEAVPLAEAPPAAVPVPLPLALPVPLPTVMSPPAPVAAPENATSLGLEEQETAVATAAIPTTAARIQLRCFIVFLLLATKLKAADAIIGGEGDRVNSARGTEVGAIASTRRADYMWTTTLLIGCTFIPPGYP